MAKQSDKRNKRVFLSLGSNLNDRISYLRDAVNQLESQELTIKKISNVYESESWGDENLNSFYNIVVESHTSLSPLELMSFTQKIEIALGRQKKTTEAYENREIDIDILFYNNEEINLDGLIIPHKFLRNRMFVLMPFREIAEDLKLGKFEETVNDLFFACNDKSKVLKLRSLF